jgi:TonB family protein
MKAKLLKSLTVHVLTVAAGVIWLTASPLSLHGAMPGQKQIEQSLRDTYKGKSLFLRNFYVSPTLHFDSKGDVMGPQGVGPWTLYSRIIVNGFRLKSNVLEIDGDRLFLLYLPENKRFQALRGRRVRIRVDLDHEPSSIQDLEPLLVKIFLKPGEDFSQLVPPYWQGFYSHMNNPDWSQKEANRGAKVPWDQKEAANGWTPPVPIHRPEPGYSAEARAARISGTVVLVAVIDQDGHVTNVVLIRPLGMGLDEQAVETTRTWTFKPAQHNGNAKAAKIIIETTFRLR